jgi:hypothetical protein
MHTAPVVVGDGKGFQIAELLQALEHLNKVLTFQTYMRSLHPRADAEVASLAILAAVVLDVRNEGPMLLISHRPEAHNVVLPADANHGVTIQEELDAQRMVIDVSYKLGTIVRLSLLHKTRPRAAMFIPAR